MVSGIIFDMDGVLIDSERQSNEGWLWAAGQLGVDMPMWLIDSFKGAPAELCCKFFDDYYKGVIDYWEAKELRTQHVYKIRETEGIPVKKGVKDIFEYIRNNGLKCAVATSTRRESAEKTLHEIGVWDYLDAVVYGDEVEHGKPEPDIFLRAAKAIGVNPSEAVVVEDSINGIKAGYAADMRVVHIPDTIAIDDDIRKLTYMVCADLNGLIDVVESINKPVINRKNVINAFAEYVRNYDPSDEKIKLKIDHTYRVAGLCQRIAESLGLSEPDVDIAWLLGMLHDIGRFEQLKEFNSFDDSNIDHADLGVKILFEEGYIKSFEEIKEENNQGVIRITLKYTEKGKKVIDGLKRISKPGLRVYASKTELPKVLNGLGIALISTSKGIMTDKKAREAGLGGEVIAYVW